MPRRPCTVLADQLESMRGQLWIESEERVKFPSLETTLKRFSLGEAKGAPSSSKQECRLTYYT